MTVSVRLKDTTREILDETERKKERERQGERDEKRQ